MRHSKLGEVGIESARRIRHIRDQIEKAKIPPSKLDENLIIGTWNIRHLGAGRSADAKRLIAEVINQFDLIAITELKDRLDDLRDVLDVLGPYWRVVYSDYRVDSPGNRERIAYVYDKRMVTFTGLAAEADPPREMGPDGEYRDAELDWWRAPYMASFRAGNFDFVMMCAHIRYKGGVRARSKSIRQLADWIQTRRGEPGVVDKDFVLVGDFNIPSRRSSAYRALTDNGILQVPSAMLNVNNTTTGASDMAYDQIVHSPTRRERFTNRGGTIEFYEESHTELFPDLTKGKFHNQMSDHYPLWIEVDTWIEDEQLDAILHGGVDA